METERLHHSLSSQVSYYSELIQKNPEWEYVGVYADEAITGTIAKKRDEFKRLIADCDAGKIDIVLCKSISRFARNTVDLLETVRHLKELGISVRFEKENIDSLSGDGEVMLTLLASFAQSESKHQQQCKMGSSQAHGAWNPERALQDISDTAGKATSWSSFRRKPPS
jgi:DNA invertase Pin-like site-specific DNA recombinase